MSNSTANAALFRASAALEMPLVYRSGQRAVLRLAKGEEGHRVFEQALAAWGQ